MKASTDNKQHRQYTTHGTETQKTTKPRRAALTHSIQPTRQGKGGGQAASQMSCETHPTGGRVRDDEPNTTTSGRWVVAGV